MTGPLRAAARPTTLVTVPSRGPVRPPGTRTARALVVLAAFSSSWTAVSLGGSGGVGGGGVKPVDLLLLAAACIGSVAVASQLRPLPAWLWVPGIGVVLVLVVHVVFPTPELYLASRTPLDAVGALLPSAPDGAVTAAVAARWLVALLVLPLLVVNLWGKQQAPLELLLWAWAAGAGASALVAVSDVVGVTQVGPGLIGYAQQAGRQTGLASQPNHLGFACALAAPAAAHLATRSGVVRRLAGAGLLALLLAGVVLSGSRGAQLGIVLVAAITAVLLLDLRRHLAALAYAASFALLGGALVAGRVADALGHLLRFGDDPGAAQSDSIRLLYAQQAARDVEHRPVFGVGYQVLVEAHNIYLQALAAGGVVLLASLLLLLGGALRTSFRLGRRGDRLAVALFACVLTWVVCGLIENQLTDRYLYVPVAAVASLAAATRTPDRTS